MKNAKSGGAIAEFLIGICMIAAAFSMVWMNERRQVRMYKLISKAEADCVDIHDSIDD